MPGPSPRSAVAVQLAVRSWGSGPRTALLVHGFSDDSTTWWSVAPALAARGFAVQAPDLRGHGASPRCASYALEELAADLVATLPTAVDLAIGHSLGALSLALAAPDLQPAALVLVDPPWGRTLGALALGGALPTQRDRLAPESLGWSERDIEVELSSNALTDPQVPGLLVAALGTDQPLPMPAPCVPTLVLVPERDPLLGHEAQAAAAAAGYEVRVVADAGHVVHRDALAHFLEALPLPGALAS